MDRVRQAAIVFGAGYLFVGLIGFAVTGFDGFVTNGDDALLIFELNPFHNVVHIVIGLIWLLGARLSPAGATEGVHQGIGVFLLAGTLLGVLGALPLLSIDGPAAPDNFLHLVSSVAAFSAAFLLGRSTPRSARAPAPSPSPTSSTPSMSAP